MGDDDLERMEIHIERVAEGLWRATSPQARGLHVVGKTPAGALHAASDALAEVAPGSVWAANEMQREDAGPRGAEPAPGGVSTSSEGRRAPASPRPEREALARLIDPFSQGAPSDEAGEAADRIPAAGYVTPSAHAAALRERWEAGRDAVTRLIAARIADWSDGWRRGHMLLDDARALTPPETTTPEDRP
jgi:hypothetical protein